MAEHEASIDLKLSNHTLGQAVEQIEGALDPAVGCEPTRSDLIRLLALVVTDLRLVHRTNDGVMRRLK